MKRKWKILAVTFAVLAMIFSCRAAYRAYEISTRPEPALAWWEYGPSGFGYAALRFESFGLPMPQNPIGIFTRSTLYAANADCSKIWIVTSGSPSAFSNNFYSSPYWARIENGKMPFIESEWNTSQRGEIFPKQMIDLKTGKRVKYDPIAKTPNVLSDSIHDSEPSNMYYGSFNNSLYDEIIPLFDTNETTKSSLVGFYNALKYRTAKPPLSGIDFVLAKGYSNVTYTGHQDLLIITSNTEYTGYNNIPKSYPTGRIGFFDLASAQPTYLYNVGVIEKDSGYYPVVFPHSPSKVISTLALADTKVRIRCLAPQYQNADSLFLMSINVRKGKSPLDSVHLVKLSASTGIIGTYDLPEELLRLFESAQIIRNVLRAWYFPDSNNIYVLFWAPHIPEKSYKSELWLYRWSELYGWEQVYDYVSDLKAAPVFINDRNFTYIEVGDDYYKKGILSIKQLDTLSGEVKLVRQSNGEVLSLHSATN